MNSPISRAILALAACPLLAGNAHALTPFSDKFDAKSLNTIRWSLKNFGKGKLAQGSGRINFTVAKPQTDDDYATLELRNNQPGYNESWEVILDVVQWVKIGTFSPKGSGGNRNANWNMNPGSGRFGVSIYGFGFEARKAVPFGKVNMDNFALKAVK